MDIPGIKRRGANLPEDAPISSDLFRVVTPLYDFSSDSDELSIGELFSLTRYRHGSSLPFPLVPDDPFYKVLQLYEPDFLMWQLASPVAETFSRPLSNPAFSCTSSEAAEAILTSEVMANTLDRVFFFPAVNLFRLLRLFKPGRLVAGDSFCILKGDKELYGTVFWRRCSEMVIDYGLLPMMSGSYALSSLEVPFFNLFSGSLLPVLESLQKASNINSPSALEVALELYSEDEQRLDLAVLNAFTAFEALLMGNESSEITYRLSLRVANLLEFDDASRVKTFRDMKEFYELRSKIIHGSASKLNPKLQTRLQELDSLRELLRRTILSVMALNLDGNLTGKRLDVLLDEIVLNQAKRMEVQELAAKFLHVEATPPHIVQ